MIVEDAVNPCATIIELQICRLLIVEYLVGEWVALASGRHLVWNKFVSLQSTHMLL